MKYKTHQYQAKFTLPDSDTVYTMNREVIDKEVIERELLKEGAKIVSIKTVG